LKRITRIPLAPGWGQAKKNEISRQTRGGGNKGGTSSIDPTEKGRRDMVKNNLETEMGKDLGTQKKRALLMKQ